MHVDHICPICNTPLELKQINLTSAVYICMDLKCPYPVNREDCYLVKRRLRDINKPLADIKREFELKHVKTEFTTQPESVRSSVDSSPSVVSDTDLPMQEIDDLLNSIDQKPTKTEFNEDEFTYINIESILAEGNPTPALQNEQIKTENRGLGDELDVIPMSESEYQDMDNFLTDLLK